jgi:competence protein ComEC
MSFFVIFDFVLRRSPDKLTTLSLTGALMCLADPTAAINISFQLSFLATFGLIAGSNCISIPLKVELDEKPFGKSVQNILSSVVLSLCAMFFCLAPIAYSFKSISLLAPVANLVCTPFAELMLVLAFLLMPISVLPHFARIFGLIYQGVGHVFTFLCSILNNERLVLHFENKALVFSCALLTAFCILLFLISYKRKKAALLVFVTGSAALSVVCSFL